MVPDHSGGAEAQRPASLLEAPTYVHVVACSAELRVESSDRLETGFAEHHVAAGNVLRLAVAQKDVNGPPRGACHALSDRSIARRSDIRTTHRGMRRGEERGREIGKPVRVGVGVVVDIGDDLACRLLQARVARAG